jgi:hypothetical protein
MAILQSTLSDDIISRQERSVLRGVNRAAQLNEGILAIDKVLHTLSSATTPAVNNSVELGILQNKDDILIIKQYLIEQVVAALVNTRVPGRNARKGSELEVQ